MTANNESLHGKISVERLPELALPVVRLIEQTEPHIVVGCDRGARLFGLAVHATWRQVNPGSPFPTLDGKIHFARVSRSADESLLQERFDSIVDLSLKDGIRRGNRLEEGENLSALFVDEWSLTGTTRRLAEKLGRKHGAQVALAFMREEGATNLPMSVVWNDEDPNDVGIDYAVDDSYYQMSETQVPAAVRSSRAIQNRQKFKEQRDYSII